MNLTRRSAIGVTASGPGLALVPAARAAAPGDPPDLTPMTELVAAWVGDGIVPGAGLVVGQGDHILLERYFGSSARA